LSQHPKLLARAVHGVSMDWTLKEDRACGLFYCTTLTGGRWCHTTVANV